LYGQANELTQTPSPQVFESMSLRIAQEKRTLKNSNDVPVMDAPGPAPAFALAWSRLTPSHREGD
jgi:hypothetical protein